MSNKMLRCNICDGKGTWIQYPSSADAVLFHKKPVRVVCSTCHGTGYVKEGSALASVAFCATVGFAFGGPVGAALGGVVGGVIDQLDKASRR